MAGSNLGRHWVDTKTCMERRSCFPARYYLSFGLYLEFIRTELNTSTGIYILKGLKQKPLFRIIHVPCIKTRHHTLSNNCTIIRYSDAHKCGKPHISFGPFPPSSGRYSTKKNTIMATYVCAHLWHAGNIPENRTVNLGRKIVWLITVFLNLCETAAQ